jgi:hypothetical protein
MEWNSGEALYSENYSIGVDGLSRAGKYTASKWFEPTTLDVLPDELS